MEQINSLDDSTVSLSSPTSSIGKKRKPGPKASVFISFFCEGKCSECGYVPKDKLTASNAKRHLHNSHPHLPIFNEDPSKLLALYAATSSMSLCHIENPYLKELLSMIPGFQVPTRRALAGMINRQCEKTMNDIRERVRKSPAKISISADIATTKGMRRSYLGVAVHFFCDESKSLRVAALDMVEMEERHTGPAIAEVLSNVLSEANLGKRPMRYVTDGASNMKAAIWDPFLNRNVDPVEQEMEFLLVDQAEYVTLDTPYNYEADNNEQEDEQVESPFFDFPFHTVCAAHSLQLVLKDVFEKDSEMISLRKRIFAIIGKFAKSHEATKSLAKRAGYKLLFPANTRWSSLQITYSRLLLIFDDLNLVCLSQKWPTIEPSDAFLLKHVCRIIEPFREVTDSLQQDKNPSISRLLPGILCLSKFLQDQTTLRSICTKLRARLEIRFDHVLSSGMPGSDPIYVAASFFDPSVSCLDVLLGWEKKAKNAIKFIVEKFADDEDSQVEHVWVDEAVSEPIRKNLFSFYGTNLRPTIHLQSEISNLSEEIDAFLANLWNSGIPEEATLFWERNKSVYKQISPVALSVLASPVHSGAVERMFSQLTLNTSGHKGSTNPALASRKVLMNFNKKFIS